MMSREQFVKYRNTSGKFWNMSYEQYLQWANKREKESLNRKLIIAGLAIALIFGILLGLLLS